MSGVDLVVVGAGPAGLAAALAAAECGLHVTLVDERPAPGGQYLGGQQPAATPAERQGRSLLERLPHHLIELRSQTVVWDLSPDLHVSLFGPRGADIVAARAVIVAGGGRELVLPFPGWTLPGVMTAGAAQLLVKKYGVTPGRRVLLAGSGPLLLPAASALAGAGATVVAVLEAGHPAAWLPQGPALALAVAGGGRLAEGWHYLNDLRRAHIPYQFDRAAIRALGADRVEAVVTARLDAAGQPIPGTEKTVDVDLLCVGFGLLPNIELTRVAGCAHHYDPAAGGWVPVLDAHLQTTVPGLFAAGETAGIGGALVALTEGRLAALYATTALGCRTAGRLSTDLQRLAEARRRQRRFGALVNTLFAPPAGLDRLATGDTPVCRCEAVLAGELRTAIGQGVRQLDELKTRTRVGQGYCQGRTCGPLAARLISAQAGLSVAGIEGFSVRAPVKPVPLGALAQEATL